MPASSTPFFGLLITHPSSVQSRLSALGRVISKSVARQRAVAITSMLDSIMRQIGVVPLTDGITMRERFRCKVGYHSLHDEQA